MPTHRAAVLLALSCVILAGCGNGAILDQANLFSWFDVTIENDTSRGVEVSLCYDGPVCRNREVTDTVAPHDFVQDAVGNDKGGVVVFRIEASTRTPRCLFVSFRAGERSATRRVSTASHCATASAVNRAAAPRPHVHALRTSLPTLRNAVARGTLISIDPRARHAEFRLTCGWYIHPRRRIRSRLVKVSLSGLAFEWESYPNGPASGISHTESFTSWERRAEHSGWSGTLYLSTRNGFLTDGPTTDICAGVLG